MPGQPRKAKRRPRYAPRNAHGDGTGLDLDLERLHLRSIAAVELVQDLPVQLDLHRASLRRLRERRLARRSRQPCVRSCGPTRGALRLSRQPSSSFPSSGRASSNTSTPAEELADVAEQDAARLALVPADAVHFDLGAKGLRAQVLRPRPHVGHATEALLETAVCRISNHRGVEARAGHDREALAVEAADVEAAALAAKPDRDGLLRCPSGSQGSSRTDSPCPPE